MYGINNAKLKLLVGAFVSLIGLYAKLANTLQVTLLDTTNLDTLGWVTHSTGDEDIGRRGWREASYNNRGDVFRVYTVCNVAAVTVDNWLRLPYIVVPSDHDVKHTLQTTTTSSSSRTGDTENLQIRLYVEMKFTMRRCTKYPDLDRLQSCRESFKLLARATTSEDEEDVLTRGQSDWRPDGYRMVGAVAADRVFDESADAATAVNVETRGFTVSGGSGVYFALRDEGACATLLGIRIYYIVCEAVVTDFTIFPTSVTSPELTSVVQIHGSCVENAGTVDGVRPSYFCQADGNWYFRTGLCKCLPGYQPFNESTQCLACPVGSYKSSTGSDACQPCPPRSSSVELGSVECRCDEGHYRSSSRGPDADCTRPPGSVEDLVITKTDATMVSLSWQPPQDKGGEAVVRYHVDCVSCESERDAPIYRPSQSRLNETRVTVSGLIPGRQYTFSVHAENSVSDVSGVFHHSYVSITTDTSASQRVTNVRITDVGVDYVSITWRDVIVPPPNVGHHDINNLVTYEARCVKASELGRQIGTSSNTSSIVTSRTNATFLGLATNTEYLIAVRWKSLKGWSDFSDDVSVLTGQTLVHYQHENPVAIVAGSIVAIALCIVIGLIMIAVIVRRSRHSYCEKHSSDRDVLHSVVANPQAVDNVIVNNHLGSFITLPRDGSVRSYVDPHTYEDPAEAVREFTKEIDASFITIEAVIGGGEFGDVCRGRLKVPGKPEMVVAIKTLKSGASEKNYLDFLTEASIMGQFDDPNVIYLQGVVTRTNPIMIITEFMQNGALNRFLQNNDGQFTVLQLIGMLRGIASGMRYLSEIGFVHRDLAARNILVNESLVCKVADFGLSREMELHSSSGSYTSEGGRIPIRWTAPEAIAYRKFSSSSDVWSYGVVAWEVMSYGEYPYWNWSNEDVINVINTPFRLPPPMDCPEVIYQLMRSCWAKERADRPKFAHIVQSLDRLIRSPELLRELAKPRMNDALSLCRPHPSTSGLDHNAAASLPLLVKSIRPSSTSVVAATASETVPVADWLAGIKMERYAGQLEQAGYRSTADAARLQRQDLVALGITLAGHQKRILSCAAALRVPSGSGTTSAAAADGGRCAVSNEASFV